MEFLAPNCTHISTGRNIFDMREVKRASIKGDGRSRELVVWFKDGQEVHYRGEGATRAWEAMEVYCAMAAVVSIPEVMPAPVIDFRAMDKPFTAPCSRCGARADMVFGGPILCDNCKKEPPAESDPAKKEAEQAAPEPTPFADVAAALVHEADGEPNVLVFNFHGVSTTVRRQHPDLVELLRSYVARAIQEQVEKALTNWESKMETANLCAQQERERAVAAEREACAWVANEVARSLPPGTETDNYVAAAYKRACYTIADAIRSRSAPTPSAPEPAKAQAEPAHGCTGFTHRIDPRTRKCIHCGVSDIVLLGGAPTPSAPNNPSA